MDHVQDQLEDYGQALTGDRVLLAADAGAKSRLPVFLNALYEPLKGELFGRQWTFLVQRAGTSSTPAEIANHARLAARALHADVVLVFSALPAFNRKRLVQKRVPFIVPGRQIFLPTHYVDLKERGTGSALPRPSDRVSVPGQVLLLFHLLKGSEPSERPLSEWAAVLKYSRMTLTRAAQELANAGLASRTERGKMVLLRFAPERRQLWERAVPLLSDPVARRTHVLLKGAPPSDALEAGLTALARYSDLAEGSQRILAMSRRALEAAEQRGLMEVVHDAETGTTAVEQWRYEPRLLAENGRTVDPLSLYLSLRGAGDERVQAALKQLLEGMRWSKG